VGAPVQPDESTGPLFSVVVPTYNRPRLLHEAVESVLAQTVDDLECVVVDNGSPDPVTLPRHRRLRLVRREVNGGPAAARNTGIAASRGRYLTFLDDDDVLAPRRLELALVGLGRADLALCHRGSLDGPGRTREALEGSVHDVICDGFSPHLGQAALPRRLCPRLDERFAGCEDVDWYLRATRRLRVTTVPEVGYLLRTHDQPRGDDGAPARIAGSRLLLDVHHDYFRVHPRARAFRELRIGLLALAMDDPLEARTAFVRSWRAHPDPRALRYLVTAQTALLHSRGRRGPDRTAA
jgi:glycosyltransferase involved in cell wall biosynthesis